MHAGNISGTNPLSFFLCLIKFWSPYKQVDSKQKLKEVQKQISKALFLHMFLLTNPPYNSQPYRLSKLQTSSAQLSDTVGLCLIPQLCTYSLDIGSKKKARKVVSFITYIVSFCTEIKFVLPFLQSFKSIA